MEWWPVEWSGVGWTPPHHPRTRSSPLPPPPSTHTPVCALQAASANSPAVQEMMAGMDMSPDKMKAQFDAMGMTPDQFISKVGGKVARV